MRTAQVSQNRRGPTLGWAAAGRAACTRTAGLALLLSTVLLAGGGSWTTAGAVAVAVLLTAAGQAALERWLPSRVTPAAPPRPAPGLEVDPDRTTSLLEALGEGVLLVDGSGHVTFANAAARRVLRRPTQAPDGELLWSVLPAELASIAHEAWRSARAAVDAPAGERQPVRHAGITCRERVYDLTAVQATSWLTGRDYGVLFLFVDGTRNVELQRLKDRFLSSVSHELRTPLTNICAYAEILRTLLPGESAEWPEFVRVIHEEGLQLSRLVDAMFDYLQLESGEAVFRSEVLDGALAVREVVRAAAAAAAARQIDLEFVEHSSAPRLLADPDRLRQVVRNLLDNALKFTPTGGTVRVSVGARDEGWELRIDDSGPGVPPEDRRAVFEKFHQLRDHMTDKPSGTGLGLATGQAVVARFGGLIWCEDSPLGGAGFVVLLPGCDQPRLALPVGDPGGVQLVASQRPANQPSAVAARQPATVAAMLPTAVP
ncbi:MAG: PAS domain-containing protein [Planctomycetes bacterium]|nr:PAS domain-containing protein [Planctomycetota bacterium]